MGSSDYVPLDDGHDEEHVASLMTPNSSVPSTHHERTNVMETPVAAIPAPAPVAGHPFSPHSGFSFASADPGGVASGWEVPDEVPLHGRMWRGSVLNCTGDGSGRDWSICCIGFWFPYILFGQNMRRALGLKYVKEATLYFVCVVFLRWLIGSFANAACGTAPSLSFSRHHTSFLTGRRMLQHAANAANTLQPAGTWQSSSELEMELEEWEEESDVWSKCMTPYTAAADVTWVLTFAFFYYAGWRRTQIRRRFGLPGSDNWDYVSWAFCGPCTLCQESRTLAYNNVDNGRWGGPVPAGYGAPLGGFLMPMAGIGPQPPQTAYGYAAPAGMVPMQQQPPIHWMPQQPYVFQQAVVASPHAVAMELQNAQQQQQQQQLQQQQRPTAAHVQDMRTQHELL